MRNLEEKLKIELDVIGRERKRKNVAQRDLPRIDQSSPKMDVEEMSFSEKKLNHAPPFPSRDVYHK